MQYVFHAVKPKGSLHPYPTLMTVRTDSEQNALQYMEYEYGMKVTKMVRNFVWMELRDGSTVKYRLERE